jgi:hypothetical protein
MLGAGAVRPRTAAQDGRAYRRALGERSTFTASPGVEPEQVYMTLAPGTRYRRQCP